MRFIRQHCLLIVLVSGIAGVCQAQTTVSSDVKNLGTARPPSSKLIRSVVVPPDAIQLPKRPKIKFTPRPLTDSNGRRVDPRLQVEVEGRRKRTAGELIEGTNSLEKALNETGASLYTNEADENTPLVPIRAFIRTDFSKMAQELAKKGGMKGGNGFKIPRNVAAELIAAEKASKIIKLNKQDISPAELERLRKQGEKILYAAKMQAYEANRYKGPEEFRKDYPLVDETLGDPAWFGGSIKAGASVIGNMKQRVVTAYADVNASILGQDVSLLHALAEAGGTAPLRRSPLQIKIPGGAPPQTSTLKLEASVLGKDLLSPSISQTTAGEISKAVTDSVNWEYSFTIPIIPAINAVGTVGAHGSATLTAKLTATADGGTMTLTPEIKTQVYAQAGISVGFAIASVEGGVGAEMTLIDYRIDLNAGIGSTVVNYNDIRHPAIVAPMSVSHNFTTLKGRLYGYAKIKYWLPFSTRSKMLWQGNLLTWDGFTDSRVLASNNSEPVPLPFPYFADIPNAPSP